SVPFCPCAPGSSPPCPASTATTMSLFRLATLVGSTGLGTLFFVAVFWNPLTVFSAIALLAVLTRVVLSSVVLISGFFATFTDVPGALSNNSITKRWPFMLLVLKDVFLGLISFFKSTTILISFLFFGA